MNRLKNIHHDRYKVDNIQYANFLWEDCTKKKEVIQDKSRKFAIDLKNIAYTSIYYNGTPMIYVTTPVMTCLWGMSKQSNQISLQFTDVKNDTSMKSFYNFIKDVEIHNMRNLGITEDNMDEYGTQIRIDKSGKYEPNLSVKVPFVDNRFDVEVFNDEKEIINIYNINNFVKMICDIYIDKIWKYNDIFYCKWKARKIYLV
tara:strand:- start:2888 stop:3490 length:603 start_codon:yes stop_codon:yes gene_type:complete